MWICYDPNAPYPQAPQPGRGITRRVSADAAHPGNHTPPAGLASFWLDDGLLVHGARNADVEAFYEITAPDTLVPKDQAIVDAAKLAELKARMLTFVRLAANGHIEATWPLWRQINADAGIYPPEVKTQKDADIATVITESNRVEDLIDAATDQTDVDAALATLNWPVLGG